MYLQKIYNIPQSLVLGFYQDENIKIISFEGNAVVFETAEPLIWESSQMQFSVFDLQRYSYRDFEVVDCAIVESKEKDFSAQYRVQFDCSKNTAFLETIQKLEGILGEKPLGKVFQEYSTDYTEKEAVFCKNMMEQERYWYHFHLDEEYESVCSSLNEVEYAFAINNFDKYKLFSEQGIEKGVQTVLKEKNLDMHPLLSKKISRVYIGNEFCSLNFPQQKVFEQLLEQALKENVRITVTLSFQREKNLEKGKKIVQFLEKWCNIHNQSIEVVVNDWGMLYYVTEYCEKINPVLGRNFNKQKKDPRIDNRLGEFQLKEEYRENNLNSAELSEFLKARGIQRYEYETCVQKIKIPSGIHSLHFPFYQMNTSQYCTLYAACFNFQRSRQNPLDSCPQYCDEICFLYPEDMNTIGYGNSIFGYAKEILEDSQMLKYYVENGIDRFVVDFL